MIIIRLKGGLGNQMFQYACGRALALRNKDALKLDISSYATPNGIDAMREYSLSHFNIEEKIAGDEEAARLRFPHGALSKYAASFLKKILRQFNVGFIPSVLSKKGDIYLDGFWQSEKYFLDCADAIRRDLTLKKPFSPAAQAIAEKITAEKTPSVSIHIRRGDVARDAATNPYYGITTAEYYSKALLHIAEKVKNFRVFVFSDDIEWTKKNIVIPYPTTYVSGVPEAGKQNSIPDYEEITLMGMCDNNIIANSTFSWWGAWLNKNPEKIIVAPAKWITRGKKKHADTIPTSWTRL